MDSPSRDRKLPPTVEWITPTDGESPVMKEAARLAHILATNWRRGLHSQAEELLADHPLMQKHPRAALRVIYEEVCQRHELGQEVALAELQKRFPQWQDALGMVLDCHRLLGLAPDSVNFPEVGDILGEFRLLAELGRGGMGRVYLAEQAFLAGRLMVLKVTPCNNQEHLSLARLQHTHIVPLYSVRDFPDRNLRKLCMPCLGGATLQKLLRRLRSVPVEKRTGRELLEALQSGVADPRLYWVTQGPNRRFLEKASYVQAVCWIGVCLADALQYAHEQGLVHLDIKPSNVLLTADCQPMLLDFHLARGPISPPGDSAEWLGGTPSYMSPEQQLAWHACRRMEPIAVAVDARSDVYSLGLLLKEALYGVAPAADPGQGNEAMPPRHDLSRGLRDILAHCLSPNPEARYSSAALVANDLRRHLTNRPLVGVRNRSFRERIRKWHHRRPQALLWTLLLTGLLGAALAFGALYAREASQRLGEAEAALAQGRLQMTEGRYTEAVRTFDRGLERIGAEHAGRTLASELGRWRLRAARAHNVQTLHEQVENNRYLHGDDLLSPATLRTLAAQCRVAWEKRGLLLPMEKDVLDANTEENLRRDLVDVAVLWSHCLVRLAPPTAMEEARREALRILGEAESICGPSPVLSREQSLLAGALGLATGKAKGEFTPRTAWEDYALGRWLLHADNLDEAAAAFDCAVELRPQDFWPWFGKGLCAHRRQHADEAVTAFSVCIALAPGNAACYHNRAMALAAQGEYVRALRDYDRALQLDAHFAAAALNRGALHLQNHDFAKAQADFRLALNLGAKPVAVHFNQALLHQAQQEPATALACLALALHHDPNHRPSLDLQASLHKQLRLAGQKAK